MADPLSILSSAVALVAVATRTSSLAWTLIDRWHDAPYQARQLSEDIKISRQLAEHLRTIVSAMENDLTCPTHDFVEALSLQINIATPIWAEIEQKLRWVEASRAGGSKIRKDRWIRVSQKVAALQCMLKEIRFRT